MKRLFVNAIIAILVVIVLTVSGCGSQPDGKSSSASQKEIPVIPHQVDSSMVCADCHRDGKNNAKITKHIDRPGCTQCHKTKGN